MEHRLLTGDSLHEPKGVENATNGQVYVANGSGSGSWTDRLSGVINLNTFSMSGTIMDVSAPNNSFFLVVPQKSKLTRVQTVLSNTITVANSVVTIYKNGIAQTPTITINSTGSGAGVTTTTTTDISFNDGDTIELRTNGASDTTALLAVSLKFVAVA